MKNKEPGIFFPVSFYSRIYGNKFRMAIQPPVKRRGLFRKKGKPLNGLNKTRVRRRVNPSREISEIRMYENKWRV
jgi:hypothetical protein